MSKSPAYIKLRAALNPVLKGKYWDALLESLASTDALNEQNVLAAKEQLFIATASEIYLDRLMSSLGITRPIGVGIDDNTFRELGIKVTNSKLVTNVLLDVLEIFYGSEATRANTVTGVPERYNLKDGDTLSIKVDGKILLVTFSAQDFNEINRASAQEVAAAISRASFEQGFTLTASVHIDYDTGANFVKIFSGTKGPKSNIVILGGSAQNVLKFPEQKLSIGKIGTTFSMSFFNEFVRFTWTGGPDPQLGFLDIGDYVNIYGSGFLERNRGVFTVENVQGGSVGQAFFDIINPNFQLQPPVILTGTDGVSGGGVVLKTLNIASAPNGLVRNSNVVTVETTLPHNFSFGQKIVIKESENPSFNGTFYVNTIVSPTKFTYLQFGSNITSGLGKVSSSSDIEISPIGAIRSGGVTTIKTNSNHYLQVGDTVEILGIDDSSFAGLITVTSTTSNTFTYTQDFSSDVMFFKPTIWNLQKLGRYATIYEVNPYEIVVFLPVTSNIVKRTLIGSAHLNPSAAQSILSGSFVFNSKEGFSIKKEYTTITQDIYSGESIKIAFGQDTSQFPDQEGFLVFDYGTSNQEGPVRYLGRPSTGSFIIDPTYTFTKTHSAGSSVTLINDRRPYSPKTDGTDYPMYLTGTNKGRIESEKIIKQLSAAGVALNIILVTPKGPGLMDVEQLYADDQV